MTTQQIIEALNAMHIAADDEYEAMDRIRELTDQLEKNNNGHLACEALIQVLERHPEVDFGGPGDIVHLVEKFSGHYEAILYASLERRPAPYTLMLYNRIINGMRKSKQKRELIDRYKIFAKNPKADKETKRSALDYYAYHSGRKME